MKAKSTVQLTTLARAVAYLEADPRLRAPDDLAVSSLDPALACIVRSSLLRRLAIFLYQRWLAPWRLPVHDRAHQAYRYGSPIRA